MACSSRSRRSKAEPSRQAAAGLARKSKALAALIPFTTAFHAHGQRGPVEQPADVDVTEMDAVRVTAPRPVQRLYRSSPVERTPPTVFERNWRDPVSLQRIGMEGGVVPLLVRHLAKEAPKAAERYVPGWTPQVRLAT